ncbi:MAG: GNAT family N-acetyltransferase [Gammaproteobacteria bacterium]
MPITIRPAEERDCALILSFIRDLAEYERLSHEVVATEEKLHRTLFGERRFAESIIANLDGEPVGFALFFHNYSTFLGQPGIYLEDLYVRPAARGRGVGEKLLAHLARLAIDRGCGRLEWWVLDWNEAALAFYRKLGAVPMDEWTVQRVTGSALEALARRT